MTSLFKSLKSPYRTVVVCVGLIMLHKETVASLLVQDSFGEIFYPGPKECNKDWTDTEYSKSWKFPVRPGNGLYLQVLNLKNLLCSISILSIQTNSFEKNSFGFCGSNITIYNLYAFEPVCVKFRSRASHCSVELVFKFSYFDFEVVVTTIRGVVAADEDVVFTLTNRGFGRLHADVICYVTFSDNKTIAFNSTAQAIRYFPLPGSYSYKATCSGLDWPRPLFRYGNLVVETNFTLKHLQISFQPKIISYKTPTNISFFHTYSYPVFYHLSVEGHAVTTKGNMLILDKFLKFSRLKMDILLNETVQESLGPGVHSFVLIMYNKLSAVQYAANVSLSDFIKGFNVTTSAYVGVHPNTFDIVVSFTGGAPVTVALKIRRVPGIEVVSNLTANCFKDCKLMTVNGSVGKGLYKIDAYAYNSKSGTTLSWGPFQALPQAYEAYITSFTSVMSNSEAVVYIFIRADQGIFELSLYHRNDVRKMQVNVDKSFYRHDLQEHTPFNSSSFLLKHASMFFGKPGNHEVRLVANNTKQTFYFSGNIFVKERLSCLRRVKIGGRPAERWSSEPLQVVKSAEFGAEVDLSCVDESEILFSWEAHRITSIVNVPSARSRALMKTSVNQADILLDNSILSPGMYVIMVTVTVMSQPSSDVSRVIDKDEDFIFLQMNNRIVEIYITGGNTREVGINTSSLILEASNHRVEKRIKYNWYCAFTVDELPRDLKNPSLASRESCLESRELLIATGKKVNLRMIHLIRSSEYYFRLIVHGVGIATWFSDQHVSVLPYNAPDMKLRCITNCEKFVSVRYPVVYQMHCQRCIEIHWLLRNETQSMRMRRCENMTVCKLNFDEIGSIEGSGISLQVVGYHASRMHASTLTRLTVGSVPKGGSCSFTPPTGRTLLTMFTVSCRNFVDGHSPLKYKFELASRAEGNEPHLLQYGYKPALTNIIIAPSTNNFAKMVVEICNTLGRCTVRHVIARVLSTNPLAARYYVARGVVLRVKEKNLQTVNQNLASLPDTAVLKTSEVHRIVEHINNVKLISMETVKEVLDVLNGATKHIEEVSHEDKDLVWKKLSEIKTYALKLSSFGFSSRLVDSVFRECLYIAARLMLSAHYTMNKRKEAARIMEFGRVLMKSLLPGELPLTFVTSSFAAELKRTSVAVTIDDVNDGNAWLKLPRMIRFNSDDIINKEFFRFNATAINFNTYRRRVDDVIAINVTSGMTEFYPLHVKLSEPSPISFPAYHDKALPYSRFRLRVFSLCRSPRCRNIAKGLFHIQVKAKENEELSGAFLCIKIMLEEGFESLNVSIVNETTGSLMFPQMFDNKGSPIKWLFPIGHFLSTTDSFMINITADLGLHLELHAMHIEIKMLTYAINCMYWDDVIDDWNNDGCRAVSEGLHQSLSCECDQLPSSLPLGRYGRQNDRPVLLGSRQATFTENIQPDQSNSRDESISENPVVLITFLVLLTIYISLCIWANTKERLQLKKGNYTEVNDNSPYDDYRYLVTVYTGNRQFSSSTASVALRLVGTGRKSSVHLIQQTEEKTILRRATVTSFLITTKEGLGEITAVRLWHDNGGYSPEWFLQRMAVRDLETDRCWFFMCNTWFDHDIDHLFMPTKIRDLLSIYTLFWIKLEVYIKNRHLLYSIIAMYPWTYREMSRVERLSSAFLHLSMMMVFTFLFYPENQVSRFNLPYYSFQWTHVLIGMLSAVICYPATLFVTGLFRFSKMKGEIKASRHRKDESDAQMKDKRRMKVKNKPSITRDKDGREIPDFHYEDEVSDIDKSMGDGRSHGKKDNYESRKDKIFDLVGQLYSHTDEDDRGKETGVFGDLNSKEGSLSAKSSSDGHKSIDNRRKRDGVARDDTRQLKRKNSVRFLLPDKDKKASRRDSGPDIDYRIFTRKEMDIRQFQGLYDRRFQRDYKYDPKAKLHNNRANKKPQHRVSPRASSHKLWYKRPPPGGWGKQTKAKISTIKLEKAELQKSSLKPKQQRNWVRPYKMEDVSSSEEEFLSCTELRPSAGIFSDEEFFTPESDEDPKAFSKSFVDASGFNGNYRPLPSFFRYIAWSLILGGSITCVAFSFVLGARRGVRTCEKWLVSLLGALLETFVVLEPLSASIFSLVNTIRNRNIDLCDWIPPLFEEVIPREHHDQEEEYFRQKVERGTNRAYTPKEFSEDAEEKAEKKSQERKIRRRIKDVSVHILYLSLLLVAALGLRKQSFINFRETLKFMIVDSAEEISERDQVYDWIESTLAGSFSNKHLNFFFDEQLVLLSKPTLRQKRVLQGRSCYHTEAAVNLKLSDTAECKLELEVWTEEKGNYGPGWNKSNGENVTIRGFGKSSPWEYATEDVAWLAHYYGEHGVYDGRGYFVEIPQNQSETLVVSNYLKQGDWIDNQTRFLILEVALYNVPTGTYCIFNVAIEILNIGTMTVTSHMLFMKSHHVMTNLDIFIYICLYGVLLMVFYHLLEIASKMREKGIHFLNNLWNILHVTTLILSVWAVVLFLTRASYLDLASYAYSNNFTSYYLFHTAAHLDYITRCFLSACVFMTMCYTMKILEGHPIFDLMHATVRRAKNDLQGHSMYMVFIYCAFCHLGVLLFYETKDFSTLIRTMQSVMGYSMEAFTSSDLLADYPVLGWYYLLVFVAIFTKIFVNFYITILENSYRETKLLRRDTFKRSHVFSFGQKQLRSMFAVKEQILSEMKTKKEKKKYLNLLNDIKQSNKVKF